MIRFEKILTPSPITSKSPMKKKSPFFCIWGARIRWLCQGSSPYPEWMNAAALPAGLLRARPSGRSAKSDRRKEYFCKAFWGTPEPAATGIDVKVAIDTNCPATHDKHFRVLDSISFPIVKVYYPKQQPFLMIKPLSLCLQKTNDHECCRD